MDDRAFASATELSAEIRDRRIGCVELLDFYLARAERHNPALNAIVVWQVDNARERRPRRRCRSRTRRALGTAARHSDDGQGIVQRRAALVLAERISGRENRG
jgi:Asp-tRNA(Asn)/Glu-tRNA(Gln) amidotransferase A subunit family amidase